MRKLKSIEINELPDGRAFAEGVYVRRAEVKYEGHEGELYRERIIWPIEYQKCRREAERMASAANVSLFDYVALSAMLDRA